jgi:hypothetical protein
MAVNSLQNKQATIAVWGRATCFRVTLRVFEFGIQPDGHAMTLLGKLMPSSEALWETAPERIVSNLLKFVKADLIPRRLLVVLPRASILGLKILLAAE